MRSFNGQYIKDMASSQAGLQALIHRKGDPIMATNRVRTKSPVDFSGLSSVDYWDVVFSMSHDDGHVCGVDCWIYFKVPGDDSTASGHMMYAQEPSTAAGRYQWEQNQKITTRREWDASGQAQSRSCREWDRARALLFLRGEYPHPFRTKHGSRRALRHARKVFADRIENEVDSEGDLILTDPEDLWGSPEGAYE